MSHVMQLENNLLTKILNMAQLNTHFILVKRIKHLPV